MSAADLGDESSKFAADISAMLAACLPGASPVIAEQTDNRYVVRLADGHDLELTVRGVPVGTLDLWFRCTLDSHGRYLAVDESDVRLRWRVVRDPLLRLHFRRHPKGSPSAHWHVHAERGAFSAMLATGPSRKPHSLSSLHIPVGGGRMRPSLEDFVEFLIRECGVDARDGWESALQRGREQWRRFQISTLVRDAPEEAIRVLTEHGYTVLPPQNVLPGKPGSLRCW